MFICVFFLKKTKKIALFIFCHFFLSLSSDSQPSKHSPFIQLKAKKSKKKEKFLKQINESKTKKNFFFSFYFLYKKNKEVNDQSKQMKLK